jgi:hypothetical protein
MKHRPPAVGDILLAVVPAAGILFYAFLNLQRPPRVDEWIAYLITSTALRHTEWLLFDFSLRPLFTLSSSLFVRALPHIGYHAIEIMNFGVSLGTLWLTYRIGRSTGLSNRYAWLAVWLCAFSFAFLDFAWSTFTEPLLSFFLVLALLFYTRGRYRLCGVCFSAVLLCQPMTFPLAPLWLIALWRKDKAASALCLLFPAAWLLAGGIVGVNLVRRLFLHTRIPWSQTGENGYLLYAAQLFFHVYGPVLSLAFLLGLTQRDWIRSHCFLVLNLFYFLLLPPTLVTFGDLFHFTGGVEPRYLSPSIPLASVLASRAVCAFAPGLWSVAGIGTPGPRATSPIPPHPQWLRDLRVLFVQSVIVVPFFHHSQTDLTRFHATLASAARPFVEQGAVLYVPYPNLGFAYHAGLRDMTKLGCYFLRDGRFYIDGYNEEGENIQYPLSFEQAPGGAILLWTGDFVYDEQARRVVQMGKTPYGLEGWEQLKAHAAHPWVVYRNPPPRL